MKKITSRIRIPVITESNTIRKLRTENYRIMEEVRREEMKKTCNFPLIIKKKVGNIKTLQDFF